MSAQPGFPRCARYSVLRRDLGPKPRPKVHLRWRTGDWTALLPVLNEKFSSKSPPGRIRPILGEHDRNPYSSVLERHPCGDITDRTNPRPLLEKGVAAASPPLLARNHLRVRQGPGLPRCRMSTAIFAETHTDRAMGPDMWLGASVFANERAGTA